MKVCFFGLGSIGMRHLQNLVSLCTQKNLSLEIDAFRSGAGSNCGRKGFPDVPIRFCLTEEELQEEYDIVFVTNPTALHGETLQRHGGRGKAFFVEKPVFMYPHEWNFLNPDLFREKITYVACPLRYHPVLRFLKNHFVAEEGHQILSVRAFCSSYLPDWRPDQDYRKNYSASRNKGGGVALDLIHEWDYLRHLFGDPLEVSAFHAKVSSLDISSDDSAEYIARYPDFLASVHLDYFGRVPRRFLEIMTEEDTVCADFLSFSVSWLRSGEKRIFPREDYYVCEMEYFLNKVLKKERTWNDLEEGIATLQVALEGVRME